MKRKTNKHNFAFILLVRIGPCKPILNFNNNLMSSDHLLNFSGGTASFHVVFSSAYNYGEKDLTRGGRGDLSFRNKFRK